MYDFDLQVPIIRFVRLTNLLNRARVLVESVLDKLMLQKNVFFIYNFL